MSIRGFLEGAGALASGMALTLSHLLRRPITEQYPEELRRLPPRSRGRIVLTRDPDGVERCVACYLCSAVCPVSCISMQSTEAPDGRRMAAWFRINFARCIYCGLCEEACPTSAIQLINEFKSCERDLLALVHEKEDLLIQGCGKDPDTCFYRYAGVVTARGDKGGHRGEAPPVDIHSNLP